jgi:heme/copper-type cytochrome/quinol oxidase subunit 3
VVGTLIFTALMLGDTVQEKHLTDASDAAFYWNFMVGSWVVLYILVYWSPRFLP